jgi:hypothetical protein
MKRGTDCVIHSCSLCNPKPMELVCQTAYDARSALLDLLLTHIHSWRLLCYRCIHLTPSGSATASILPRVCTIEAAQAPTRPMQVLEKQPCPSARADYAAVHTIPIVLRQYRYCEIACRSFVNGLPCYSQPHVSFFPRGLLLRHALCKCRRNLTLQTS